MRGCYAADETRVKAVRADRPDERGHDTESAPSIGACDRRTVALGAGIVARLLLPLAGYAGVVVWLTWPLGAHLTTHLAATHMACRVDGLLVTWALAFESRALTSPAALAGGNIFHPTTHSLFYGEPAFGALPYFAVPFLATGNPAFATNVTFLLSTILTAWALHVVAERASGSPLGGIVAASTFLATPWVLWRWSPCAPNYAVLQYMPVLVHLAAKQAMTARTAIVVAVLVVLQGLASPYLAVAVMLPLAAVAAIRVAVRSTRATGVRLVVALAAAASVVGLAFAGHLLVRQLEPALARQSVYYPQGLVTRTALPFGPFGPGAPAGVSRVAWVMILLGMLSLLLPGSRAIAPAARRVWRHAVLWTLVGLAASLTPVVTWWGKPVRLPHAMLASYYATLRAPSRLALPALIGLSLLAGLGFVAYVRRLDALARTREGRYVASTGKLALFACCAFGVWVTYVARASHRPRAALEPYPLYEVARTVGPIDRWLSRPGGPLLELPVAGGAIPHVWAMYRSIFHGRDLLNGYSGYWPTGFRWRMALACRLPDPQAVAELRRSTGVELILVHGYQLWMARHGPRKLPYGCPPDPVREAQAVELAEWERVIAAKRPDLTLLERDGADFLFRVNEVGYEERR
jgi:hypothetical protein